MDIEIKRVYDAPAAADGHRALVDRLWPRGLSREAARLDEWAKDAAPSAQLRTWFGHRPERFEEFAELYSAELATDAVKREAARALLARAGEGRLTLLYAARDSAVNHAAILRRYLLARAGEEGGAASHTTHRERGERMNTETIMGIRTGERRENVEALQRVLTAFGCNIRMRLGLHEAGDVCSDEGLILLQLVGAAEETEKLRAALAAIEGLRFETMEI